MGPQHMPLLSASNSKAQPNQYTPHISLNYAYSWPFGGVDWVFSPTSSEPSSPIRYEEDSRVGWTSFTDNEERLSAVGREEHSHQGSQQSVETVLGGLQAEVVMTVMDAEREQPVLRSALKMDVVERVWRASRHPDGSSGMPVMCAAAATTTELTSSSTPAWAAPMLAWTRRLKKKAAQADDRPAKKAKTLKREITLHAIVTNPSVKTQHDERVRKEEAARRQSERKAREDRAAFIAAERAKKETLVRGVRVVHEEHGQGTVIDVQAAGAAGFRPCRGSEHGVFVQFDIGAVCEYVEGELSRIERVEAAPFCVEWPSQYAAVWQHAAVWTDAEDDVKMLSDVDAFFSHGDTEDCFKDGTSTSEATSVVAPAPEVKLTRKRRKLRMRDPIMKGSRGHNKNLRPRGHNAKWRTKKDACLHLRSRWVARAMARQLHMQ